MSQEAARFVSRAKDEALAEWERHEFYGRAFRDFSVRRLTMRRAVFSIIGRPCLPKENRRLPIRWPARAGRTGRPRRRKLLRKLWLRGAGLDATSLGRSAKGEGARSSPDWRPTRSTHVGWAGRLRRSRARRCFGRLSRARLGERETDAEQAFGRLYDFRVERPRLERHVLRQAVGDDAQRRQPAVRLVFGGNEMPRRAMRSRSSPSCPRSPSRSPPSGRGCGNPRTKASSASTGRSAGCGTGAVAPPA